MGERQGEKKEGKGDEKGGRRTEKCERRETYIETFKHREKRAKETKLSALYREELQREG